MTGVALQQEQAIDSGVALDDGLAGDGLEFQPDPLTPLAPVLSQSYAERDTSKPWVFWHTYWSSKTGEKCTGPYQDRKKIMATLCRKVGVPYFRFHALRHAGASLMEGANVPIGSIQRILGHEQRKTTETYLHSLGESGATST